MPPPVTEHEAAFWIALGAASLQEVAAQGRFPDQVWHNCSTEVNLGGGRGWLKLATHGCFRDRHLGSSCTWPELVMHSYSLDENPPKGGEGSRDPPIPSPPSTSSFKKRAGEKAAHSSAMLLHLLQAEEPGPNRSSFVLFQVASGSLVRHPLRGDGHPLSAVQCSSNGCNGSNAAPPTAVPPPHFKGGKNEAAHIVLPMQCRE